MGKPSHPYHNRGPWRNGFPVNTAWTSTFYEVELLTRYHNSGNNVLAKTYIIVDSV